MTAARQRVTGRDEGEQMLKWCSYCQQFMHEIAPYDDFSISHGLCASCEATYEDLFASDELDRPIFLREIFHALFDAGRHEDFETASRIIERAIAANCRPVDILIGMISPMLYEIGEEWKRGALSVEDEQRFTAFSEQVISLVESIIRGTGATAVPSPRTPLLLLMNAPGNRHHVGLRILALWLEDRGARVRIIDGDIDRERLLQSIATEQVSHLLISMAVTDQFDHVAALCGAVQSLPPGVRPKVIVGGYPVKAGLISEIPAAELLSDVSALRIQ